MMIECRNVSKQFNNLKVLSDFNAVFETGKHYGITGPSGCGKTTLLRIIGGLVKPDSGQVVVRAEKNENCLFSWMFQEDRLLEDKTAAQNLRWACPSRTEAECRELLIQMGISPTMLSMPLRSFSGGMKRRVALCRCLLFPAAIYLLDEPYKGLDADTRNQAHALVEAFTRNHTVLMISHEAVLPEHYMEIRLRGIDKKLTI